MKLIAKAGIGVVVASLIGMAFLAFPSVAGIAPMAGSMSSNMPMLGPPNPGWNTGNLCTTITTVGMVETCTSTQSGFPGSPLVLNYNFENTPATAEGWTLNINVEGSYDCLIINVHSFYSTVNLNLDGSFYSCAGTSVLGGAVTSSVNVAINSEGDTFNVQQYGSNYNATYYVYGTTVPVALALNGSHDFPTVNYIGTGAGFTPCPWALESKSFVTEVQLLSYGSFNMLNTTWVNGPGYSGLNHGQVISAWPVMGDYGSHNSLGDTITTSAPANSCAYLT